jgi:hypothetical protein
MALEELLQALTKYVMGNRQEFDELKERFESMDDWSAPGAAALAYLIAKDELGAKKEEEEEESDVYDEAVEVMKKYGHPHSHISPHTATDEIFTLIYEWLDKSLAEKNYPLLGVTRRDIEELFLPFAIARPKA